MMKILSKRTLRNSSRGQVILILSMFLGVSVAVGIAIAGFLTVFQIRQARGAANSAKAIFAADAGLEWGLCGIVHPAPGPRVCSGPPAPDQRFCPPLPPTFGNDAEVEIEVECRGNLPRKIISTGSVGETVRVLELQLGSGP